jgi:hypothetical protein
MTNGLVECQAILAQAILAVNISRRKDWVRIRWKKQACLE